MNLVLLMSVFFLVSMAFSLSALYFLVAAPSEKKALRARLEAVRETSGLSSVGPETELLRQEVLSNVPAVNRLLLRVRPLVRLNLYLEQAGSKITVGTLLGLSSLAAIAGGFIGQLAFMPGILTFALILGAGSVPFMVIAVKRHRRISKFEEQFPDAIDLLARAVRAGHAFTTGLELIGNEMPEPVAAEFRRTFEQQNLGLPLRDALQNLFLRVPTPDVDVFVTALVIQRESGGNLAEILDNLSRVIRERFKLMRQVKVFTAQGRMSLYFLTALPPIMALCLYLLNRNYIARLVTDPLGQKGLLVGVVLQVMGYLVIRNIIRPKI